MVRTVRTERLSHWTATIGSSHFQRLRALEAQAWQLVFVIGRKLIHVEHRQDVRPTVYQLDFGYLAASLRIRHLSA